MARKRPDKKYESRLLIAKKAIKQDPTLSIRTAAKIYSIKYNTLHYRLQDKPSHHNIEANSKILSPVEEQSIIDYILELTARSFPPRILIVEDMANCNKPGLRKVATANRYSATKWGQISRD